MPKDKTFYDIAEMSEKFQKLMEEPTTSSWSANDWHEWHVISRLMCAQQLSVISGTLSDFLALCKKQSQKA